MSCENHRIVGLESEVRQLTRELAEARADAPFWHTIARQTAEQLADVRARAEKAEAALADARRVLAEVREALATIALDGGLTATIGLENGVYIEDLLAAVRAIAAPASQAEEDFDDLDGLRVMDAVERRRRAK